MKAVISPVAGLSQQRSPVIEKFPPPSPRFAWRRNAKTRTPSSGTADLVSQAQITSPDPSPAAELTWLRPPDCSSHSPASGSPAQTRHQHTTIKPKQQNPHRGKKTGKITSNNLLKECGCVCFGDIKFALRGYSHIAMDSWVTRLTQMMRWRWKKKRGHTIWISSGESSSSARPSSHRLAVASWTSDTLFSIQKKTEALKTLVLSSAPTHETKSP